MLVGSVWVWGVCVFGSGLDGFGYGERMGGDGDGEDREKGMGIGMGIMGWYIIPCLYSCQ